MSMNQNTPHFSMEELREIYAAAAEKTKQGIVGAAKTLYPDREAEAEDALLDQGRRQSLQGSKRKLS